MTDQITDLREPEAFTDGLKRTQFGELTVVQARVDLYLQGQYSPLDRREIFSQIDGSDLVGASVTSSADQTNPSGLVKLDSGTNSGESVKLESNRALDYAPGDVAEWSALVFRDSGPVDDQTLSFGLFSDEDGLFFRETADGLQAVIRDGSGGTVDDRVLSTSDEAVVDGTLDLQKSQLGSPRIWFIRFSHYGAGKVLFGTRESLRISTLHPGRTEKIFATYDATKEELDRLYMRTANLPLRVQADNGSSSPSSPLTVSVGDRQASLFGDEGRQGTQLEQQYSDLTAQADTPTVACALRPKARFAGMPNGVNVVLQGVELEVAGGTSPVRFWAELDPDVSAGTYDDSDYDPADSASEIALGNAQTGGDLSASVGTGLDLQPAGNVSVGTTGSAPSASGGDNAEAPLGVEQPIVIWVEGDGGVSEFDLTLKWRESQ